MIIKILSIVIFMVVFATAIYLPIAVDSLLLDSIPWLLIVSTLIGIIFGALRARFKSKPLIKNGYVTRHGFGAFIEHWVTAFGISLLIFSGFLLGYLFFPHYTDTPKTVLFPLNIHFMGLVITTFGGFYFLTDHIFSKRLNILMPNIKDIIIGTLAKYFTKNKLLREGKYLASQKSAFLIFAILGSVLLITGIIKIITHFVTTPLLTLAITTLIHDIFSLLFIIMLIVHILFAISISSHRTLLKSWFTGKISEKYAIDRHIEWYDELKNSENKDVKPSI